MYKFLISAVLSWTFPLELVFADSILDTKVFSAQTQVRQHEIQAALSRSGDLLATAWTDDSSPTGLTGWTCAFSASQDQGKTWTPTVFFRNSQYQLSGNPTIGIDSTGKIYALCMSVDGDYAKGALDLATSNDGGRSWTSWSAVVSQVDGITDRPKLLVDRQNRLHVIYTLVSRTHIEWEPLKTSIVYVRSENGGKSWTKPVELSDEKEAGGIFVKGFQGGAIQETQAGEIISSWGEYYGLRLFFRKSGDGGKTFQNASSISMGPESVILGVPCTELSTDSTGQKILMSVHEGHKIGLVRRVVSEDGGKTWLGPMTVTESGTNFAMAVDSHDRIHGIYLEQTGDTFGLKYRTSLDFGKSFSEPIAIAGGPYTMKIENEDEFMMALGSYQTLVAGPNDRLFGFWLDFQKAYDRPRVLFSNWILP